MNKLEIFRDIETLIFDVDGVLTDSFVHVQEDGSLLRRMNIRDGYALKRAVQQGLRVIIISGGKSQGVRIRLNRLGIEDIHLGVSDKMEVYRQVVDRYDLDEGTILYMGDDLPDYELMRRVGLPCCPADAVAEVKAVATYISPRVGGQGCARDVIEKVMKLRDLW
ncbi:MAG: 3-deoxy-D-manno-octulosonate 8-phosphate phosphatase [Bacteroidetes bacterium]|nr:MAG: 3-deoxy-D-manno-octulosonate 8-phosphate phosphatase [Bacteroidota bacterium]